MGLKLKILFKLILVISFYDFHVDIKNFKSHMTHHFYWTVLLQILSLLAYLRSLSLPLSSPFSQHQFPPFSWIISIKIYFYFLYLKNKNLLWFFSTFLYNSLAENSSKDLFVYNYYLHFSPAFLSWRPLKLHLGLFIQLTYGIHLTRHRSGSTLSS